MIGGILFIIGAALQAGAVHLAMLIVGRIMLGFGVRCCCCCCCCCCWSFAVLSPGMPALAFALKRVQIRTGVARQ